MGYPQLPSKIIPFNSAKSISPSDVGRQFDEHSASLKSILEFLRKIIRDDGQLRNGIVGPEQLAPTIVATIAKGIVEEAEKLLADVRSIAAEAAAAAGAVRQAHYEIAGYQHSLSCSASILQEGARQARIDLLEATSHAAQTDLPTGVLGPTVAMPGFYGTDAFGAQATAQDYAQVSLEWAEHMPDTIPPNILAINAVTGDHWSSRWWANKSANAFGMLAWWYQGAWPQPGPPSTPYTPTGQPIPVGALYYDTTLNTMMVWNGSTWINAAAPQKAATASLYYTATASQTVFPLSAIDNNGKNFAFNQTDPEGIQVLVNGVRVEPGLDFTVNTATSTVTMQRPLPAGAAVIFDLLTPASRLSPSGTATTFILTPIVPNGVQTVFAGLTKAADAQLINVTHNEEIFISVDGVHQQPGASYTAFGNTVTFAQAPDANSVVYMIWFGPPPAGTTIGDAPNDGQLYGRQSLAWAAVPAAPAASSTTPVMDGVAAVGVGTTFARADHRHPSDTTIPGPASIASPMNGAAAVGVATTYARQDHVHASDTSRAPTASPTFTGTVTIPGGTINATSVGATTPSTGAFTTLSTNAAVTFTTGPVTVPGGTTGAKFGALPFNATTDANASSGGVPLNGIYRNGSILMVRTV